MRHKLYTQSYFYIMQLKHIKIICEILDAIYTQMINECIGLLCMGDIYTQSLYLAYNNAVTAAVHLMLVEV